MTLRIAWLALIAVTVPGCGTSNIAVEQSARSTLRAHSVSLQYDGRAGGVPKTVAAYLQGRMDESFFRRDPAFGRGGDIIVRYGFSSSERSGRLSRAILGSKTVLEAEVLDPQGNVLARMRSQQDIGLLGGGSYAAIDRAVAEIREYMVARFQR